MVKHFLTKYLIIGIFLAIIIVTLIIIRPFITSILTAIVLAYVFYPLFRWVNKKFKRKNLSAIAVSIFIVLLIIVPAFFLLQMITKEAYVNYIIVKQKLLSGEVISEKCNEVGNVICKFSNQIKEFVSEPKVRYYLETGSAKVANYLIDKVSSIIFSIPYLLLNFFVIIFIMFYLFKDGKSVVQRLKNILPFKKSHQGYVFNQFNDVIYAVMYGHLVVAFIQGALGGIGFWVFDIGSPVLWGIVMMMFALIPFVGPPFIWLPMSLFKIAQGIAANDNSFVTKGILMIIYGTLVVGSIDNILKPKLISGKSDIHPILVLLGLLGGLKVFGFIGIIIGPLILAMFAVFVKIYEEEKSPLRF